jgi:thiamine biosynthesis lipoprotein
LLVWQRSGGAFDISVGPLVELWGFGARGARTQAPAHEDIERIRAQIGLAGLSLAPDAMAVRKAHAHTRLDLGGIAKGYALDRVAQRLDEQGFDAYLVEVGGELRARGARADGAPWRIGIEKPIGTRHAVQRVVEPGARAIASSGDYRNFFEHDGVRFSHTIDPRTGWPVRHDLAAVSVIADDAMSADALATAILVKGAEAGLEFAARNAVAAHLMVRSADGLRELISPAMQPHIVA